MMVVVGFLRLSGFFIRLTEWSLDRIRTPRGLLLVTILLSGILSAFLVNDIVCLALTPLVLHLARRLRFEPMPHLIGAGNRREHRVGRHHHRQSAEHDHRRAIAHPLCALCDPPDAGGVAGAGLDFVVVAWVYRNRLEANRGADGSTGKSSPSQGTQAAPGRVHRWLRRKSGVIALITVILFFTGLPIAVVAVGAAAVLMIDRMKPERIYRQVDGVCC